MPENVESHGCRPERPTPVRKDQDSCWLSQGHPPLLPVTTAGGHSSGGDTELNGHCLAAEERHFFTRPRGFSLQDPPPKFGQSHLPERYLPWRYLLRDLRGVCPPFTSMEYSNIVFRRYFLSRQALLMVTWSYCEGDGRHRGRQGENFLDSWKKPSSSSS